MIYINIYIINMLTIIDQKKKKIVKWRTYFQSQRTLYVSQEIVKECPAETKYEYMQQNMNTYNKSSHSINGFCYCYKTLACKFSSRISQ